MLHIAGCYSPKQQFGCCRGTTLISWVQTLLGAILSKIFSLADALLEWTGDHHFKLTIATLNWWLPLRTGYCQFEFAIAALNWEVPLRTRDCHFELEVANCQFIVALASSKLLNAISQKVFIAWPRWAPYFILEISSSRPPPSPPLSWWIVDVVLR